MGDKYRSFERLEAGEREGVDYRVRVKDKGSAVVIIAPHGGSIEPGTSTIAQAIAGDNHSLYCFEGIKTDDNSTLHITSHRFDEPQCVSLVAESERVVSVHGLVGDREEVLVGGLDRELRDLIRHSLTSVGFKASVRSKGDFAGTDPANICNRGKNRSGVQLEITKALRDRLKGKRLESFAQAVREAVAEVSL